MARQDQGEPPPRAAELARLLAWQADKLAAELLPAGRRDGQEWRVGSLAGERGQSLAVHLSGPRAGVWCDFASGERGDALDLVAAALFRGDKTQAMRWAVGWLGLDDGGTAIVPCMSMPAPSHGADTGAHDRRSAARRLFQVARPSLLGTPAAAYLAARGINLADLGRQPRSLRFHPALANRETGREWPALVAAVVDAMGCHTATHRTWLAEREGRWGKAPLREPKMSLGSVAGGTIRLWRGTSGKPLAQAPDQEVVVIGEGIETCLSIVVACPELRVLAAVSLANMARIVLPARARTVILAADNDAPDNEAATRGLCRAIDHFSGEGRIVRVARSPIGKDFNDALTVASDEHA